MTQSRRIKDQKSKSLRQQGTLNPRPESVTDELFLEGEFFDPRDLVQVKYEMLRRVQQEEQSITETAEKFGLSRPSFYKAQEDFSRDGLSGLIPKKRGRKKPHKLTKEVMEYIEDIRSDTGTLGARELSQRVKDHFDLEVHPRSIERALRRREKKR